MNWHRPDVETSVLDALTKTHGPISARQMVDGLIAKGRTQALDTVEELIAELGRDKDDAVVYWQLDGVKTVKERLTHKPGDQDTTYASARGEPGDGAV